MIIVSLFVYFHWKLIIISFLSINKRKVKSSGVSPKPILLKYNLVSGFTGCGEDDKRQEIEGLVREELVTSLHCVVHEECLVKEVSCSQNEFSVLVKPAFLHHIEKQTILLKTASQFLTNTLTNVFSSEVITYQKLILI